MYEKSETPSVSIRKRPSLIFPIRGNLQLLAFFAATERNCSKPLQKCVGQNFQLTSFMCPVKASTRSSSLQQRQNNCFMTTYLFCCLFFGFFLPKYHSDTLFGVFSSFAFGRIKRNCSPVKKTACFFQLHKFLNSDADD